MATDNYQHTARLQRTLMESDRQPEWRGMRSRCHQYYDGNQLEQEVITSLKAKKLPILINNLIQPTINGVLGMEARSRTDWFVKPDDDEFAEIAEAVNKLVNEATRTSKADKACAEAYKYQCIGGIGWVELKKNRDPMGSEFSCNFVHPNEIFFDWATSPDLSNCEWLRRERWVKVEIAKAHFPQHKEIIDNAVDRWAGADMNDSWNQGETLSQAYREYTESNRDPAEWLRQERDMVKVYELYYRVWKDTDIMRLSNGRVVEIDYDNPMHVAAINSGRVEVETRPIPKMRLSWYIGPHFIKDMPSPHPHNLFPYVPFFGAREDETGIPYGIVRSMLSPQDEVNFRRIHLTAGLMYKQVIMDDDATEMNDDDLRMQVHSVDGIIKLNSKAKREGGGRFEINQDSGVNQQQFSVMLDAAKNIQEVGGVFNAMLGKETSGQSGVAINSLVEQGATTLADINDNYRDSRQVLGELYMAYIIDKHKGMDNVIVMVPGQLGKKAKQIILNNRNEGEATNDIALARTQVVMGEIQQSAGYRAQVSQMLMDFFGKLPGEFQAVGLDIVIEQMDIPEEKKIRLLKLVQKVTGDIDPEDMTPEQQQQAAQAQQKQQQLEQMQLQEIMLKLEKLQADIEKTKADSQYTAERAQSEQVDQQKTLVEIENESATPPPLPDNWPVAMQ